MLSLSIGESKTSKEFTIIKLQVTNKKNKNINHKTQAPGFLQLTSDNKL